jgi:hypothetical protein
VLKFSNFFGNAGINATGAESNFFGQNAGYLATNKKLKFLWWWSWLSATNANTSNFFGRMLVWCNKCL